MVSDLLGGDSEGLVTLWGDAEGRRLAIDEWSGSGHYLDRYFVSDKFDSGYPPEQGVRSQGFACR